VCGYLSGRDSTR